MGNMPTSPILPKYRIDCFSQLSASGLVAAACIQPGIPQSLNTWIVSINIMSSQSFGYSSNQHGKDRTHRRPSLLREANETVHREESNLEADFSTEDLFDRSYEGCV